MRFTVPMCLLVALAVTVSGQSLAKDADGWDQIKWGMTIQETRAKYKAETQPQSTEYWTFQRLESIKISDIDMNVDAMAKHGSDRVTRVQLTYIKSPNGPSESLAFDTLKTLLIQKYGPFASDEPTNQFGRGRRILWTLPSTSIVLESNAVALTVNYTATDKKALDAL